MNLFNTLTKKIETFQAIKDKEVGLYTCGPTVYWFAHIGNFRTYIFEDILKRALRYDDYKVKHVMNITDVGHLTSDSDTGEDKLEKGAAREHKTVWEIAEYYTSAFINDMRVLNIVEPDVWVKATDTISKQIELIKVLEQKGFTYIIDDGVYFDTQKLGDKYGRLWTDLEKKELRGRIEENKQKKNSADFALWKFSPKDQKRQMEWDSPWGIGFPGWHTECVVMGGENLGLPFDIHCGGIDHVSIHHTNEIAQAEAAYDKIPANYWMHGEFLTLKDAKMSKSADNITTISQLKQKNINPLAYRYLCLNTHYRSKMVYSEESLAFAQTSLDKLYKKMGEFRNNKENEKTNLAKFEEYQKSFIEKINDDLDMPGVLALVWEIVKDDQLSNKEKYDLLIDYDKVMGLKLSEVSYKVGSKDTEYIIETKDENGMSVWTDDLKILPKELLEKLEQRKQLRENKNWEESDKIRQEIKEMGWILEDSEGQVVIHQAK